MANAPDESNAADNPSNPLFAKEIADGAFLAGIAAMFVLAVVVVGSITHKAEMHAASSSSLHHSVGRGAPGKG